MVEVLRLKSNQSLSKVSFGSKMIGAQSGFLSQKDSFKGILIDYEEAKPAGREEPREPSSHETGLRLFGSSANEQAADLSENSSRILLAKDEALTHGEDNNIRMKSMESNGRMFFDEKQGTAPGHRLLSPQSAGPPKSKKIQKTERLVPGEAEAQNSSRPSSNVFHSNPSSTKNQSTSSIYLAKNFNFFFPSSLLEKKIYHSRNFRSFPQKLYHYFSFIFFIF
jgi:hypothetical protein